jgi:predicted pyridoxine 5'-phosphate oxidase superfamily flavin-nucleotide-binding protein
MSDEKAPVLIDDTMSATVNGAFENERPVVVAYVDGNGQPHLSFRGSVQVFSEDQLALWIREREGGLVRAIEHNPRLTMMYRDSSTKTTYLFYGRAKREDEPATSKLIYDNTPKGERDRDPEMAGVAVVVDIDAIQGGPPDRRVNMARK